jgi:6-phosphogluconolactonase
MTSIYVGTYTEAPAGAGEGIALYDFDDASGRLALSTVFDAGPNPSFLALNADRTRLYAVNELDDGMVSAFERDPETGGLRFINRQASHGGAPCFVGFDPNGSHALVANYNGGTAAALPVDADGGLEPASAVIDHRSGAIKPRRATPPHPHMIAPTPDGRFMIVTDLGLDATLLYRFDNGALRLTEHGVIEAVIGAGPRHFAFSPDGSTAYVINELNSTLDVFAYDGATFSRRQTLSSLPRDFTGANSCAQVLVAPDGRFVYGSNRGHDSIAIWPIDPSTGVVREARFAASGGACPRNFAMSPDGRWLVAANQESNNLVVFARDAETGALRRSDQQIEIGSPVCVLFCP